MDCSAQHHCRCIDPGFLKPSGDVFDPWVERICILVSVVSLSNGESLKKKVITAPIMCKFAVFNLTHIKYSWV